MQLISQILEHPSLLAYFTGANNYAWLQFRNGDRRLLAKPLTYFEERLPSFVRIHKTALINPAYVVGMQAPHRSKMAGFVHLEDGTQLSVSRRRWQEVVQLLNINSPTTDSPDNFLPASVTPDQADIDAESVRKVHAIMMGDTLLLTQQCLRNLDIPSVLHHNKSGAALATVLRLENPETWPDLIIIDARRASGDSSITLQALKSHTQLRAIPVIWLAAPGDNTMQAYLLDANSVVIMPKDTKLLVNSLTQLLHYWLVITQLPEKRV